MVRVLQKEYERRGKPLDSTAWSLAQIRAYMNYQFRLIGAKQLQIQDLAGYAWRLPKKGPDGAPADLPPEMGAPPLGKD